MKKKAFAMVGLAAAAGCALSMGAASTALADTSANGIKASDGAEVFEIDAKDGGNIDLGNQGKEEKVSFLYAESEEVDDAYTGMWIVLNEDWLNAVPVVVNSYFYEPKVTFIRTKDGTGFINVAAATDDDYLVASKAYRYSDGALESVASVNPLEQFRSFENYGAHYGTNISEVKGNNFVVNGSTQFFASGITNFKYELFKTAESESDTYEPVKEAVKATSWFSKSGNKGAKRVTYSPTLKKAQLYKDANTTKKSKTVTKGTKAKVIGVNITPYNVPTLQIQTKSGTKGWIKLGKNPIKSQLFKYATFAG